MWRPLRPDPATGIRPDVALVSEMVGNAFSAYVIGPVISSALVAYGLALGDIAIASPPGVVGDDGDEGFDEDGCDGEDDGRDDDDYFEFELADGNEENDSDLD